MNPGLRTLFAAATILVVEILFLAPVVTATSTETAVAATDSRVGKGGRVEKQAVGRSISRKKPAPLRVNFDQSLHCLAMNIYHEARSESRAGQIAVASVTLNRVNSTRFPGTVCNVVKQGGQKRNRCQFSWWCDGRDDRPTNEKAWKKAMEIGRLSLMGIMGDPTDGALFYHAEYVKPSWSRSFERSARIGKHLFYKPTRRLRTAAAAGKGD